MHLTMLRLRRQGRSRAIITGTRTSCVQFWPYWRSSTKAASNSSRETSTASSRTKNRASSDTRRTDTYSPSQIVLFLFESLLEFSDQSIKCLSAMNWYAHWFLEQFPTVIILLKITKDEHAFMLITFSIGPFHIWFASHIFSKITLF